MLTLYYRKYNSDDKLQGVTLGKNDLFLLFVFLFYLYIVLSVGKTCYGRETQV